MKIRKGFVVREIADTIAVVPTGDLVKEFKGIINLNDMGKFIWELFQNDITTKEAEKKLMEQYSIKEEEATEIVQNFIQKLQDVKLIEQ